MTIDESNLPLFLGMSHRAARRGYGWDLLGVTTLVLFPFFPQRLTGLQCVLGLNRSSLQDRNNYSYKLLLTDETQPSNQGWVNQDLSLISPDQASLSGKAGFAIPSGPPEGGSTSFGWAMVGSQDELGAIEIVPVPAPPLMIGRPCRVFVDIEIDGKRYRRGEFICGFVPPAPLTDEERRAIASRPGAAKSVVFHIACKLCQSEADYYCQLNPLDERPIEVPKTAIPLNEAPSSWLCSCGQSTVELTYLKQGLHDVFRYAQTKSSEDSFMHFTPLYQAGRIQDIIAEYEQLIENTSDEEPVQKFFEAHSVCWAFLSPARIMHKPAVLTKKKADFGILTTQKILYLVELEKPSTRLTNQDGAISAEIQRGANQIRDWQLVVSDHRLALLSELGLKDNEVQEIRYILIGGLARRTSAKGLTKLRRSPFAPSTDFYCFDELGSFLHTLAGELRRLE